MASAFRTSADRLNVGGATVASFTLTLGAATVAADIALVSVLVDAGVSSISGLGATWSRIQQGNSGSDNTELWQGTGCTAGNTVITVTLAASDHADAMAVVIGAAAGVQNSAKFAGIATGGIAVAPTQTVGLVGQAVVDFFWINGGWSTQSFSDSPAAFTTLSNGSAANWYSEGESSAYRISTATGSHARTLTTGLASNQACCLYSVLVGDASPAAAPRRAPITVVSQAVTRPAVY